MADENSKITMALRQTTVSKLEKLVGSQSQHGRNNLINAFELENRAFQEANNMKEYLGLVKKFFAEERMSQAKDKEIEACPIRLTLLQKNEDEHRDSPQTNSYQISKKISDSAIVMLRPHSKSNTIGPLMSVDSDASSVSARGQEPDATSDKKRARTDSSSKSTSRKEKKKKKKTILKFFLR